MENLKNAAKFQQNQLKKNKKTILALIISAILLISVTVILVSRSWFNTEEPLDTQVQKALQYMLEDAMSVGDESDELLTKTEERSGYKVISCTETETGVVATFLVYAPDLYTVAKDIDENYTFDTEEELQNAVVEAIGKAEIVEQKITIEFVKADNGYEPLLTMEFIDAYYGGILKLYNEKITEKNQKEAE